ncbi:MAG: DUF4159 domain-containing protein [Lentisphaeria bacterium]|nr:DUF4159 domain-containing protein [Lentisphaeria bacterium]
MIVFRYILALSFLFFSYEIKAQLTDELIGKYEERLSSALIKRQNENGSWDPQSKEYLVGTTAICLQALKQAELPNKHIAVQRAVLFIMKNSDDRTYSESLVCSALELVLEQDVKDPVFKKDLILKRMQKAVDFLVGTQTLSGDWGYSRMLRHADNSNTQFAILGLAAAERAGIAVPGNVKKRTLNHWQSTQKGDGAWGYRGAAKSSLQMTCAGLASLHLLGERVRNKDSECSQPKWNKSMLKAVNYIEKNINKRDVDMSMYTFYAVERVGINLGLKKFGNIDWYQWGIDHIVRASRNFKTNHDVALALLFIAKGKAPIAIAKWKWKGDWNNQLYDIQNWTDDYFKETNYKVDWINSEISSLDAPAAKASLIFVNGTQKLSVADKEKEFITSFLESGGTIVTEVNCDDQTFINHFMNLFKNDIFKKEDVNFEPLKKGHPLFLMRNELSLEDVDGLVMRAACKRYNVLVLKKNISGALNRDTLRIDDIERAQKVATNILDWALKNRNLGKKLDDVSLEEVEDRSTLTIDQLKRKSAGLSKQYTQPIARYRHKANWNTSPFWFDTLHRNAEKSSRLPLFDAEIYVSTGTEDIYFSPVTLFTGHGSVDLKDKDILFLRNYMQQGGAILAVAGCSDPEFHESFLQITQRIFPNDELELLSEEDPVYNRMNSKNLKVTDEYERFNQRKMPRIYGIKRDGRWLLLYSEFDIISDLSEGLHNDIPGVLNKSAAQLSNNLLTELIRPR